MDGFATKGYGLVRKTFERQLRRSSGGAAVCVYHRGEPVVDLWGGQRTDDAPWGHDTVAMCFSTTKGVVSTAVHILAERGLIDYDEPVATYWPEFAANGKAGVTVRHVLTHSSGLHRIRSLVDTGERILDWEYMTDALAAAAPAYEPGSRHGYHALTYGWLAGELVRRVSGVGIATFVDDEIARPLSCDGLFIGLPFEEQPRAATLEPVSLPRPSNDRIRHLEKRIGAGLGKMVSAMPGTVNTRRAINALAPRNVESALFGSEVMDASIPAANGFFTARSLARMYAMISGGGELDGARLLSPERVELMGEVQRTGADHVLVVPMHWRLGYHRVFTTRGSLPNAFGHFGFGGSGAWADPSRDLAVAFVCNRGSGTPVGDLRIMELGTAAVRAADRVGSAGATEVGHSP
ncbi:MAG: serine hydrolase domain-containing protein [Microthrixaceae bacterium]